MTFFVDFPFRVQREGVVDVHLEPPFEGALRMRVDAPSAEEAIEQARFLVCGLVVRSGRLNVHVEAAT